MEADAGSWMTWSCDQASNGCYSRSKINERRNPRRVSFRVRFSPFRLVQNSAARCYIRSSRAAPEPNCSPDGGVLLLATVLLIPELEGPRPT